MPNLKNLISEDIGNFRDCIDNIVYTLQRYVDQFIHYIPDHAIELKKQGCDENLIGFLVGEGESIVLNKISSSAAEAHDLLTRKLTKVINVIEKSTVDYRFYFSYSAEIWFQNYRNTSVIPYDFGYYHNNTETIDPTIYDYVNRLDTVTKEYDTRNYGTPVLIEKEDLLERLNSVKDAMHNIMTGLRQSIDLTTSCYSASIFMNIIIEYMSCIYYVFSHMAIVKA